MSEFKLHDKVYDLDHMSYGIGTITYKSDYTIMIRFEKHPLLKRGGIKYENSIMSYYSTENLVPVSFLDTMKKTKSQLKDLEL